VSLLGVNVKDYTDAVIITHLLQVTMLHASEACICHPQRFAKAVWRGRLLV